MYGLINLTNLHNKLEPIDILSLLISAVSHDLDHDGYNNAFQINACTPLALIYNDQSPLEMYHCAVAFSILTKKKFNILSNVSADSYKKFRSNVIEYVFELFDI